MLNLFKMENLNRLLPLKWHKNTSFDQGDNWVLSFNLNRLSSYLIIEHQTVKNVDPVMLNVSKLVCFYVVASKQFIGVS